MMMKNPTLIQMKECGEIAKGLMPEGSMPEQEEFDFGSVQGTCLRRYGIAVKKFHCVDLQKRMRPPGHLFNIIRKVCRRALEVLVR